MMRHLIKEVADFMRIKLCISAPLLAMSGYLLFNPLNISIIFVAISSFLVCSGVYAYNNVTDRQEDLVNHKRINKLASDIRGPLVVAVSFAIGFVQSLLLSSPISVLFCSSFIISGLIYSFFRIKRYTLIKNVYTGFAIPQLFLVGAGILSIETIVYYFLISVFFFAGSLISDMRDYTGDKAAGIDTIPVKLGYKVTKALIYCILFALMISILGLGVYGLLVFFPPILLAYSFLARDKYGFAFFYGGVPFMLLTIALVLWRILYA